MTDMLVIYASRHGATRGIAERLGRVLDAAGMRTTVADAAQAPGPEAFDALVIGGAAYMGSWLDPVKGYLDAHRAAITMRPTWLYSSGPVGKERIDAKGNDLLAPPHYLVDAAQDVGARGTKVFFGRWEPDDAPASVAERLFRLLPVSRDVLPVGDFRDWDAIDAWAREIATEVIVRVAPVATGAAAGNA
jgi:menaquinone-dependent protoporphyrinogen oxidase